MLYSHGTPKETEREVLFDNYEHNGDAAGGYMTTVCTYEDAPSTGRYHAASILNFTETLLSVYARFTVIWYD